MLKPVPVIEAEFTVTAEVPDEVRVTELVAAEFTATLPKLKVEALTFSCELAGVCAVENTISTQKFVAWKVFVVGNPLLAEWR